MRHLRLSISVRIAIGLAIGQIFMSAHAFDAHGSERPQLLSLDPMSSVSSNAHSTDQAPSELFPRTWRLGSIASFRVRGRFDADSLWTLQSAVNSLTFGELGDVVGVRRAWIGAEGRLGTYGRYVTEVDLASGNVVPRDVFIGIEDIDSIEDARFGHFLEPFSLELGTNSNSFAFMEQSSVNCLDPARNWGGALFNSNEPESTSLALGFFHSGTDDGDLQGGDGSTVGITGRWTTTPINRGDGEQLLHLAVALSERVPEAGVIIINQQPRNPLLNLGDSATSPFVPTMRIPATFQQLVNLQGAVGNGPMWAQSEWYGSLIDQSGDDNVFFHGGYASCGYFVTGEHRSYQKGFFRNFNG